MEQYIPDIYQKSIYTINYQKLLECGIKCLLYDLDNTIAPVNVKTPTDKTKELIHHLKEMGFRVLLFSNSSNQRLKVFKEELQIDGYARAAKPFPKKLLRLMDTYGYAVSEVALIGDQMLTDVKGGNRVGITTILVNPVSKKDMFVTKFNRMKEQKIMKKLRDQELFVPGKYYE